MIRQRRANNTRFWVSRVGVPILVAAITALSVWLSNRDAPSPEKASPPSPVRVLLNFDDVSTAMPPYREAADSFLAKHGITVTKVKGGEVVVLRDENDYKGLAFAAPSPHNVLTQIGCSGPTTFTLRFDTPVRRVWFNRAALKAATDSGISHPAWVVRAQDAADRQLALEQEPFTSRVGQGNNEPVRHFELAADGIVSLRVDSDYTRPPEKGNAAFCSLLLDDLALSR